MMLGSVLYYLLRWYPDNVHTLIPLLVMSIVLVLYGGIVSSGTVFPSNIVSYILSLLTLGVFVYYFKNHVEWISEEVGYGKKNEDSEPVQFWIIYFFFLLVVFISLLIKQLSLLLIFVLLYPVVYLLDNTGHRDNVLTSIQTVSTNIAKILELVFAVIMILVTGYYLEVFFGDIGYVVSFLLNIFFLLPLTTTYLTLLYLSRYPFTFKTITV